MTRSTAVRALFAVALITSSLSAQSTLSPKERLEHATASSNLEDPALRPFHLALAVGVYDKAGKNPAEGTVEIWQSGADFRRVSKLGSASETIVSHDGKMYRSASAAALPHLVDELVEQFIHPGPSPEDIASSTPELRKSTFAKTPLDCVILTQPIRDLGFDPPLGMFRTYCLDKTQNHLVATLDLGGLTAVRSRLGKFLDHDVALEASLLDGNVTRALAKETGLSTFTPDAATFVPDSTLKPVPAKPEQVASTIMENYLIHRMIMTYPDGKRSFSHPTGAIVFHARIGRDGQVETLKPIKVDDSDLGLAALLAARQYVYKPYLVDGEPVEVETTITINYNTVTH